jgi:hypothetical protein
MIEQQLAELKDILLAVHRKVANIEMQQRNPCDKCYYKQTHPKPAVPTMTDAEVRHKMVMDLDQRLGLSRPCTCEKSPEPPQTWVKEIPPLVSPETANKFLGDSVSIPVQGESGPKFVIPVVDGGGKEPGTRPEYVFPVVNETPPVTTKRVIPGVGGPLDPPITTKTNSLVERVFSRKGKGFTIETEGGQK